MIMRLNVPLHWAGKELTDRVKSSMLNLIKLCLVGLLILLGSSGLGSLLNFSGFSPICIFSGTVHTTDAGTETKTFTHQGLPIHSLPQAFSTIFNRVLKKFKLQGLPANILRLRILNWVFKKYTIQGLPTNFFTLMLQFNALRCTQSVTPC